MRISRKLKLSYWDDPYDLAEINKEIPELNVLCTLPDENCTDILVFGDVYRIGNTFGYWCSARSMGMCAIIASNRFALNYRDVYKQSSINPGIWRALVTLCKLVGKYCNEC